MKRLLNQTLELDSKGLMPQILPDTDNMSPRRNQGLLKSSSHILKCYDITILDIACSKGKTGISKDQFSLAYGVER